MVNEKPEKIKTYYIAYLDILGYKDFFENQPDDVQYFLENINESIKYAIKCKDNVNNSTILTQIADIDIKIKIFSDNIFICMEVLNNKFEQIRMLTFLGIIYDIQRMFVLNHGLFIRGSIIKGNISFNNDYIFGQGIIDAVKYEKLAKYPRIVISEEIVNLFNNNQLYNKDELEHAIEIEKKIAKKENISYEEMNLYNTMISNVNFQQRIRYGSGLLMLKWYDEIWIFSYMHRIDLEEIYGYENIKSILKLIETIYPKDFETMSRYSSEDLDESLIKHKKRVEEKLKKYGVNYDISLHKIEDAEEREKILRKYIWVTAYHNYVCDYYKKNEHKIYANCNCDARFLRLTVEVINNEHRI